MGKDERSFISREEYDALLAENAELNKKLDYLMGQLRLLKQKTFGVSSEQATEQLVGQLSLLFNEAEAWTPKESENSWNRRLWKSGLMHQAYRKMMTYIRR